MAHGVARHKQFEAVESWQQILFDIARPFARRARLHPLGNELHCLGEEGAGACGRVENLDLVDVLLDRARLAGLRIVLPGVPVDRDLGGVRQPIGEPKLALKHVVHRADDEIDHRLGRVPDAAAFALHRVVGGEEVFVEMDKGIVARGELAEIAEQRMRIAGAHHMNQVIDDVFEAAGQLGAGDVSEQALEERVGGRQLFQRFLPAKGGEVVVMEARGEHAVRNCLGVDIGELVRHQVGQQVRLETLVLTAEA